MWIYVQDYGKMFIWEALRRYLADSPVLLALMALYVVLVIGFAVRGTKRERAWFVWPGVIWLLTVFNPLVAIPLIKAFNMDVRYYRYFWLLPVPILLGYTLVKLLDRCNRVGRTVILVSILGLCIAGGRYMQPHLGIAEDLYKVDRDIIDMADYIHRDSEKEENVVLYDGNFFCEMRAYDPSMMPYIARYELESMEKELPSQEMCDEAIAQKNWHALIMYEYFGGYDFPQDLMEEALRTESLDYIVLSVGMTTQYQNFVGYGCVEIAETGKYWLLRCP